MGKVELGTEGDPGDCPSRYRGHGVATQLMEYVLKKLETETDIEAVYLNVQTSNSAAIKFYEKSRLFSFSILRLRVEAMR